jgi:hypothetical protein
MSELLDTLSAMRPLLDRATLLATPPDRTISVLAGASLQAAIDAAPAGSTLALEPGTYPWAGPLNKDMSFTTKRALAPGVRAVDADVTILSPAGLLLYAVAGFRGTALMCTDPTKNIVQALGRNFRLESGLILGSIVTGARRGLRADGDSGVVIDSQIDECWRPDTEGQAVGAWDGCRNWLFDNNYLGGASQGMLFGGGDATSASRVPMNIRVSRCDLGKNLSWLTKALVKTSFESKTGIGVHLSDVALTGAGIAQGQHGFLIICKSTNQDSHAPWSQTQGVLIERFTAKQGAGCVSFVASDGNYPSVPLGNITLRDGAFSQIDPLLYPGDGRCFQFINTPTAIMSDITLQNLVVTGQNLSAAMYFIGPPPKRLVIQNVQLPQSTYGVKIEGLAPMMTPAAMMAGIKAWAPDSVVENITVV